MSSWSAWPPEFTYSQKPRFVLDFPHLRPQDCENGISPESDSYNCIAWAARGDTQWWEPEGYYWPEGVPREYTFDAYIQAFCTRGFQECSSGSLEEGIEKIALFALARLPYPTHAARQLASGSWVSKLGPYEDIQHIDLSCLRGPLYGEPVRFMCRHRL
jgi:hypothetical protein